MPVPPASTQEALWARFAVLDHRIGILLEDTLGQQDMLARASEAVAEQHRLLDALMARPPTTE